jgi:TPR repeat protein
MAWLEKAAKQGYPLALRILGKCYYGGDGVSQSYSKAFKYFQD